MKMKKLFCNFKIFIWFFLGVILGAHNSFAASVLVEGNLDLLVPLSEYTDCLDNSPAVFFSEQVGFKGFGLLSLVDEIVITDSLQSLLLDMLKEKYQVRFEGKYAKYEVSKGEEFEIWVRAPSRLSTVNISIDGKIYSRLIDKISKRWIKVANVFLKTGNHKIGSDDTRQVIIVPKRVMQKYMDFFRKAISCKTRLVYLLLGKKLDKPFKLEVFKDSCLKIKGIFLYNNFIFSRSYPFEVHFVLSDLTMKSGKHLEFIGAEALNCDYDQFVTKNDLNIVAQFNKSDKVREGVRVKYYLKKKIDLEKWPCLIFTYKIQDSRVQNIELVFWIDKDEIFPNFPKPIIVSVDNIDYASKNFVSFYVNFKDVIKQDLEEICLKRVDVLLEKGDKVDCSREFKGKYSFVIKNLKLVRSIPFKMSSYCPKWLKVGYYYYDINGELKAVISFNKIPSNVKTVYRPEIEQVDLFKLSNKKIDLSLSNSNNGGIKEYAIKYYLDFNGDGKYDGIITEFALSFNHNLKIFLPTYQKLQEIYPHKSKYILLQIGVKELNSKQGWKYLPFAVNIQKLVRQTPIVAKRLPVVILGHHSLKGKILHETQTKSEINVNFGNIFLKKGKYKVKVLPLKEWQPKAILIEIAKPHE